MFGSQKPLPSTMKHDFARTPQATIPRSSFNRSHGYKTTFDAGYLVPVFTDEALPGDSHRLNMTAFARLSTPLFPIMDNLYLDSFFFFVPLRLVWDNFQKMMGEQATPASSIDFSAPIMDVTVAPLSTTGYIEHSLSDFLGIPTKTVALTHTTLYHRAYNLIYNEWFRDQNLQNSVTVDTDDGPDTPTDYVLLQRGKRHDYFTSCLPNPQKGTAISLPLGDEAPIFGDNMVFDAGSVNDNFAQVRDASGSGGVLRQLTTLGSSGDPLFGGSVNDGTGELKADLSEATASTINEIRQAFQLQKLLERDARGGTRYTEIVRSHFGVTSPDARLQRPEYLGGGSMPIKFHPTPQTSDNASGQLGTMGAFATAAGSGHGFTKSFTEHGLVIGMVSIRADLTYQQGLDKSFSRRTRYDWYWPALAHIGEQAVLNKEIYAQGTAGGTDDTDTFGYQERFAEYRYKPSRITGLYRANATGTLEAWHASIDFAALPTLGATFIVDAPPIDRIIAVPTEPHLFFDSYFDLISTRPMPTNSVPGMIDHF